MKKILLVDDDQMIRRMIKHILNEAKYEVWDAGNGLEASKLLEQRLPDLLITDLVMPEKEGLELIQEIRTHYSQIPIIVPYRACRRLNQGSTLKWPNHQERLFSWQNPSYLMTS